MGVGKMRDSRLAALDFLMGDLHRYILFFLGMMSLFDFFP